MNWFTVTSSFLTHILQMDVLDVKSNHLSLKLLLILVTSKHQIFTELQQSVILRDDT